MTGVCGPCEAEGRSRAAKAKGLCGAHLERLTTRGDLGPSHSAKMATLEERLTTKSRRAENGCLEWMFPDKRGYGRLEFQRERDKAHRWAWRLWVGPIPDGMSVLHKCDNPPCIEPRHLELGTKKKNNDDAWLRGRQPLLLSAEQVLEIRRRYAAGGISQQRLADEYGVGPKTISNRLRYAIIVDGPRSQ